MAELQEFLEPIRLNVSQALLDPNNPRFAVMGETFETVPEARFAEPRVQRDAHEKMKSGNFEVAELRDTIKTIGFLPMDRIVVREWRDADDDAPQYVVVEGNRRIAALKWLADLHETGRETFSERQLDNFTHIDALLLDDDSAPESALLILPGLRHVSGIQEWGPYQRARAVYRLRETGASPQDVAQSLGLSTRSANQLWRSYLALEQMNNDEEYGEYADPRKFSYFEETFKRPAVRDWLNWDDNARSFQNNENLREFFSWIVGEFDDDGRPMNPRLPEAKSIRELGQIISNESAMTVFRAANGTLSRALARYEAEHPEDWKPLIDQSESVLASLSPDALRALSAEDLASLDRLALRIDRTREDRRRLLGEEDGRSES